MRLYRSMMQHAEPSNATTNGQHYLSLRTLNAKSLLGR